MSDRDYGDINVVALAYEIIAMAKECEFLRTERDHYKKLHEIHCETIKDSNNHMNEMTGMILSAALDPESHINKSNNALLKEELLNGDDVDGFEIVKKDGEIVKIKITPEMEKDISDEQSELDQDAVREGQ